MSLISKLSLVSCSIIAAVLFAGCNDVQTSAKQVTGKPVISEESLGLRKVDLYTEDKAVPAKTEYKTAYAGSSTKINRAFQDAPPMIPHDTEGMLPITINNNQCVGCHNPDVASSMGATPIPKSHFTDFRPKHKFDGKEFEKSVDNYKNEVSIKAINHLSGARFNCSQCHAPQSDGKLIVKNNFEPEYLTKDGASKSHWEGKELTKALDTLGKNSNVTKKDIANKNSKAGSLEEAGH
jgi:cytochrome c-type protein NapB